MFPAQGIFVSSVDDFCSQGREFSFAHLQSSFCPPAKLLLPTSKIPFARLQNSLAELSACIWRVGCGIIHFVSLEKHGNKMKKSLVVLSAVVAAALPLVAATETVGGCAWACQINGETAEHC